MTTPDPRHAAVVELFHHRWNLPTVLALDEAGGAGRVAILVSQLGVSRNALRASLAALRSLQLVAANPGYGHPLRPELVLTEAGRTIADPGRAYAEAVADAELRARKWTAPVLLALTEAQRFNDVQQRIGATPRALSLALQSLVDGELVVRGVEDGRPPRSRYDLTDAGSKATEALSTVADQLST